MRFNLSLDFDTSDESPGTKDVISLRMISTLERLLRAEDIGVATISIPPSPFSIQDVLREGACHT